MKISLIEAKKLATPGKLRCEPGLVPYTHVNLISDDGEIASVWGVGAHLPSDGKAEANAALFAHLWNTHDELVEALGELFEDWQTLVGQDLRENNADVAKIWKKSEAVLARARTVEMP